MKNEKFLHGTKEKKTFFPLGVLLFSVLVVPGLADLFLGMPSRLSEFYGASYSYNGWGIALILLSEILDIVSTVISCAALTVTGMTVGFCALKKGFKGGIFPAAAALGGAFLAGVLRILEQTLLLALGISDTTASIGDQILPGLLTFGVSLLIQGILLCALLAVFAIVGKKTGGKGMLSKGKTAYMITVYIWIGLYTLAMLGDALRLALSRAEGESVFTGSVLPFAYPLIYGALMVVTALWFRTFLPEILSKKQERGKAEKRVL